MLLNVQNLRRHRVWIGVFVLGTIAALTWFLIAGWDAPAWPGGSTPSGFTFGVIAALIIVFEMLLLPRKLLRNGRFLFIRFGPVRAWMRAHIWLGLLSVPLTFMHSGLLFGGGLTTILMIIFILVILSGIYGVILQNILPRLMFEEISHETIAAQIPDVMAGHAEESRRLVERVCRLDRWSRPTGQSIALEEELVPEAITVGTSISVGKFQGRGLTTITAHSEFDIKGAEPLRKFFVEHAYPYLLYGQATGSPLARQIEANRMFQDLDSLLPPELRKVAGVLADKCTIRRQLDRQQRMDFWLHNWMALHLGLSCALVVLLGVHIWSALKYW